MLFKEVQQNYTVYILDKENMTVMEGKVIGKTLPKYNGYNNGNLHSMQKSTVDFSLEVEGKTAVYEIPEDVSVAFTNGLILTTDKELLVPEIENVKSQIDSIIANIDKFKERSEKAEKLLSEVSPKFRERKETEERFSKIEDSVNEIKDLVKSFIKEFKS